MPSFPFHTVKTMIHALDDLMQIIQDSEGLWPDIEHDSKFQKLVRDVMAFRQLLFIKKSNHSVDLD